MNEHAKSQVFWIKIITVCSFRTGRGETLTPTPATEEEKSCPKTPWIVVVGAYLIPLPAGFLCGVLFMMFRHRSKQKRKATRPYRNMLERNK